MANIRIARAYVNKPCPVLEEGNEHDRFAICVNRDEKPLPVSRRSQIVATPPDVLNKIVAALEYQRLRKEMNMTVLLFV